MTPTRNKAGKTLPDIDSAKASKTASIKMLTNESWRTPTGPLAILMIDADGERHGGVYYADEHPWNKCGPVASGLQIVYRAELIVVSHVVHSATEPNPHCF